MDFYSSISLSGTRSGFRIRIRIQSSNLNPDPTGSGSETLIKMYHTCGNYFLLWPLPHCGWKGNECRNYYNIFLVHDCMIVLSYLGPENLILSELMYSSLSRNILDTAPSQSRDWTLRPAFSSTTVQWTRARFFEAKIKYPIKKYPATLS